MSRPGTAKKKKVEHWQIIVAYLVVYDIITANLSYFLALWFRFDCIFSLIPVQYLQAWKSFIPIYSVVCLVVFRCFRLYSSMWRFASFPELLRITIASLLASVLHVVLITVFYRRMPISYDIIGAGFQFIFITGIRFSYRLMIYLRLKQVFAFLQFEFKLICHKCAAADALLAFERDARRCRRCRPDDFA